MNDVRGPDFAQPSTSAPAHGNNYELIAALTRVRGILFGEDFQQFLRGGATQRYSLTTYLDLFCYQPPEHRYTLPPEGQSMPVIDQAAYRTFFSFCCVSLPGHVCKPPHQVRHRVCSQEAVLPLFLMSCRKRGSRHHNLQKAFRSPEREKMQRARRSSHAASDSSVDDDVEMEAMAKVWAHPEDLHLFPVRTLSASDKVFMRIV